MKDPLDRYYTPMSAVDVLFKFLWAQAITYDDCHMLEPCAGQHQAIVKRAVEACISVWTNDIDPAANVDTHVNFLTDDPFPDRKFDVVMTNPPYMPKDITAFVERCMTKAEQVILLLPLRFLEPTKARRDFLFRHPPDGLLVVPRVRFLEVTDDGPRPVKGVDNAQYGWFFWGPAFKGIRIKGA